MKLYISSDHAGFELKEHLVDFLMGKGIEITDKGPFEYNETDDYPDLIAKTAQEVSNDPDNARGIVIGLSGQGEALVANKFKNVRAGICIGGRDMEEIVTLLRQHNNSNVLSFGAKFITKEEAEKAVDIWLDTEFSGDERHQRRIDKVSVIESSQH